MPNTQERQRRRIPKRLSQVAFDVVSGGEIDLPEKLGDYGDGATASDAPEGVFEIRGMVEERGGGAAAIYGGAGG